MSHIHIPDGVLPAEWLVLGNSGAFCLLLVALFRLRRYKPYEYIGKVGIVSAAMLLCMSVPLGFMPVHLNLAVLSGLILGPWAGILSVFAVNVLLALLGHGGLTTLGLNVLLISLEMLSGIVLFRLARRAMRAPLSAGVSAFVSLSLSAAVAFAIIGRTNASAVSAALGHGRSVVALLPVCAAGVIIETAIVMIAVSYLTRVRPDLLGR